MGSSNLTPARSGRARRTPRDPSWGVRTCSDSHPTISALARDPSWGVRTRARTRGRRRGTPRDPSWGVRTGLTVPTGATLADSRSLMGSSNKRMASPQACWAVSRSLMGSSNDAAAAPGPQPDQLAIPHGEFERGDRPRSAGRSRSRDPSWGVRTARVQRAPGTSSSSRSLMGSSNTSVPADRRTSVTSLAIPHGEFEPIVILLLTYDAILSRSLMGSSNNTQQG